MELQTISQVSKQFKISARTLRYYEQIGLIQSTTKEDYSYRTYDKGTILRLKQIIVLRKLRIPLKSIAEILLKENTVLAIDVFQLDETGRHGYEVWVTIPDGFSVPEPLVKKHFEGGLYAAHMIPIGAFEEWDLLNQWIGSNGKYEFRSSGDHRNMFGFMEEHLHYSNRVHLTDPEEEGCQLDLLMPIKEYL